MSTTNRDLTTDLRSALIDAKESIEGKRRLNTLDSLINDIQTLQSEGKLKAIEIEEEETEEETSLYREPNATTLAAMAEVKSGAELDELTDENIENLGK